jgi:hypothetical protein
MVATFSIRPALSLSTLLFATGSYVTKDYLILQSAGLNGTTFGALDTLGLPAGFVASLDYTIRGEQNTS